MRTSVFLLTAALSWTVLATTSSPALLANETSESVIRLRVPNDPTVSIRIWVKAGSQNDPPGKEGLAAITGRLLEEGATANNSYEQILEKLSPLAARYYCNVSTEMTIFGGRVHRDNLGEYYPLFVAALLHPAFNEDDFRRIKDETLSYLTTQLKYSSDEELGKAVLYNEIFHGTPYGHITDGSITDVENITLSDVRKFYAEHYTRDNIVIGVAGEYDEALVDALKRDLATLPTGKPNTPGMPNYAPLEGLQVTIVEKDAPATAISMGFPIDVVRGSKEWYALAIANSWFGEHRNSSSHLYQVIREARGLNYGDYSYIENFPHGGWLTKPPVNVPRRRQIFEIWIRPVPTETRHFVLRAALRELKDLVDNGMSPEEFELTRSFLKNYVLHYAPTTDKRLGYAIDDAFYGMDESHLKKFRRMMDELTLEDVNAAIRKHLQYDDMRIVFITDDAEGLREALADNTPSPIEYPTEKPGAVLEEDVLIRDFPLDISRENVKILSLESLFQ